MQIYFMTLDGTGTVLAILCTAILISFILKKLHFPVETGMLYAGLFFAVILQAGDAAPAALPLRPDRDTVMYGLIPAVFFAAAIRQEPVFMRKNLPGIVLLSLPGVLFTVLLTGGILIFLTKISPVTAFLFGALLSVPGPMSVQSLFKVIRLPDKVRALLGGESLLGSAAAFSLFTVIAGEGSRSAAAGVMPDILLFLWSLTGGLLLGAAVGALFSKMLDRMKNDDSPAILSSILLVYVTYFVAERFFQTSGIMAVSAAGLLLCRRTSAADKSAGTLAVLQGFWMRGASFAAAAVFLLIGFAHQDLFLSENWSRTVEVIFCALTAVLAARAVSIAGLTSLFSVFGSTESVSTADKALLFAGGTRGVLSLAMLCCLPTDFPDRLLLVQTVLATLFFIIPLSGLTVRGLVPALYPEERKS